ncbi:MAG: DnaD domain protein [Thermosipho sp. (in: Bacteria)]|nr:DnaD domain protein [Thermosipho sp. (in: thermotogales)]
MQSTSTLGLLLEEGVTVVPNVLLKNYTRLNLTEEELVILLQILRLRQTNNERRPMVKTLSEVTNIPETYLQEILVQLQDKKLLQIKPVQDENGRWSEVYSLDGLYTRLEELATKKKETKGREQDFDRLAKLFSQITGMPIAPKHESMIIKWLYEYQYSVEFLEYVLIECFERGGAWQKDWRIKSIIDKLYSSGIKDLEEVKNWFNLYDQDNYWFNKFASVLGRPIRSVPEKNAIRRWAKEWGFSDEIIIRAIEKACLATTNPSFNYIESILKNWKEKGIDTIEKIEKEEKTYKERKQKENSAQQTSHKRNIPKIDPETGMIII